eukprot:1145993-Pelagomonas_calceolata.AAC.3
MPLLAALLHHHCLCQMGWAAVAAAAAAAAAAGRQKKRSLGTRGPCSYREMWRTSGLGPLKLLNPHFLHCSASPAFTSRRSYLPMIR